MKSLSTLVLFLSTTTLAAVAGCAVVGVLLSFYGCSGRKSPADDARGWQAAPATAVSSVKPEPVENADNSACLDCHMDLADELIAARHLQEGVGCTACHGESVSHGEDEANVTKPDVLFGRTEIAPFCHLCHPTHEKSKAYDDLLKERRGKRTPTGVMVLGNPTCTDCHGHHIMAGAG